MGFNKIQIFFTQDLAEQKKQTDSLTVQDISLSFWVVILEETWIKSNMFLWIIESSRSKLAQLHWRFDSSREIWWKPPNKSSHILRLYDLGCSPTNSTKLRFPFALSEGDWICREASIPRDLEVTRLAVGTTSHHGEDSTSLLVFL